MRTIDKLIDHEYVSADDIQATAEWLEEDADQGEHDEEVVDSSDNHEAKLSEQTS